MRRSSRTAGPGGILLGLHAGTGFGLAVACAAIAAGLVCERILTRRFSSWGYAEREDDLLVRRGVLVYRLSVVPYGRMQFIDVRAGPLEALLRARDRAHAYGGGRE